MTKENAIKLFQDKKVRVHWDNDREKWFFSIIDVIAILAETPRPRKYWNALKTKLKNEGSEVSHKLGQLKMRANDGKMRLTDVAQKGGKVADVAREQLENTTGKKVITKSNSKEIGRAE